MATYDYDYASRRITKTVGSTVTNFVYDGWNPIAEFSGTTLSKSYVWGMDLSGSMQGAGGVGGLLSVKDGSATYYPTFDGNGNVSQYLDTTGSTVAHYEYDAFGQAIPSATNTKSFTHQFSTKQLDGETGLNYYGYRYYDSTSARWLGRDLIEENGGLNIYGMISNNVLNDWDYLGLVKTRFEVPIGATDLWSRWSLRSGEHGDPAASGSGWQSTTEDTAFSRVRIEGKKGGVNNCNTVVSPDGKSITSGNVFMYAKLEPGEDPRCEYEVVLDVAITVLTTAAGGRGGAGVSVQVPPVVGAGESIYLVRVDGLGMGGGVGNFKVSLKRLKFKVCLAPWDLLLLNTVAIVTVQGGSVGESSVETTVNKVSIKKTGALCR